METNEILKADALDIIFDGRNKQYGAYQLRKTYNRRLAYSVAIMFGICLLAVGGAVVAKPGEAKKVRMVDTFEVKLVDAIDHPVIPPPPPKPPKPEQIQQVKFTAPKLVTDVVKEQPPKQADMEDVKIGADKVVGVKSDVVAPPVETTSEPVKPLVKTEDYERVFTIVQQEAQFPGGAEAWMKYLGRNLRQDVPTDNGAAAGDYKVVVSFLVDREGNVTEVKAENDPGYGIADEAIRVIQQSGKWQPALQNGRHVIYRQRQQITFRVADGQ